MARRPGLAPRVAPVSAPGTRAPKIAGRRLVRCIGCHSAKWGATSCNGSAHIVLRYLTRTEHLENTTYRPHVIGPDIYYFKDLGWGYGIPILKSYKRLPCRNIVDGCEKVHYVKVTFGFGYDAKIKDYKLIKIASAGNVMKKMLLKYMHVVSDLKIDDLQIARATALRDIFGSSDSGSSSYKILGGLGRIVSDQSGKEEIVVKVGQMA
ncbi:hypothetical protein Syun_014025 [Stephania yunnanensis]|uniref:Uncharacterized protein n=1 Tax=Stephania yunnanensis TaxID=152371 RepID=A0AAP0PBE3_9MAGN